MVHLAEKRLVYRSQPTTTIKVFTNIADTELFVNGQSQGKASRDMNTCRWKDIRLQKGANQIKVVGTINKQTYTDSCTWYYQQIL
jgi:beta-galactosidase